MWDVGCRMWDDVIIASYIISMNPVVCITPHSGCAARLVAPYSLKDRTCELTVMNASASRKFFKCALSHNR